MSLWDNINKKRQRIKQGSGEKMRNKGDKGAPTPDQIKRAKGEDMKEGKINQMQVRRQDMAKLAGLYSKAMKAMPGSPKQKAISKQIDQYRRELGLDESVEEAKDTFIVYKKAKKASIGKIKKLATINAMPKGKMLDKVLDKYDADGVIAMSKIKRNKMQVEALEEGVGEVLLALNFAMFGAVALTFITAVGMELGVIKGSESELKTAKNDIARLKRKVQKNKQYKLDSIDKEKLNNALKIVRNAKPTAFQKLKTKLKDLVKKNKTMKEAVSPAQQAAIAIAKKEKGEKSVEENYRTLATKGMGAEEKGRVKVGDEVDFYETERGDKLVGKVIKVTNVGYTVQSMSRENKGKKYTFKYHNRTKAKKLLDESRAYRDAMKGMKSRSATRGMATTKKDKDISATDDDRKAANKNIIMQLRKAADLSTGTEVEFERGKGKVSRAQAQAALARFNSLTKPNDKEKFQKSIKSLADIKKILGR